MNKNDTIIYVDLGSSNIRTVAGLVNENGELEILGDINKPSNSIKNGIINDPHNTAYIISESIKLLSNKARLQSPYTIVITVNAYSMKSHTHSVEKSIQNFVSETLLRELKNNCLQELSSDQIHIFECTPQHYYVDGEEQTDPKNVKGNRIIAEYNAIIGNKRIIDTIEKAFFRTAHAVRLILLGAQALSTALLEEEEREDGAAIISFGGGTTTLSVYHNNKLQNLSVVPLGGINITNDIEHLQIGASYAELLKVKKGVAADVYLDELINIEVPSVDHPTEKKVKVSTRFLAQIIEARLEEILKPLFEQLNEVPYPLKSGIVITGGGAKLSGLCEYIQEKTGFQTRIGDHEGWLSENTAQKYLEPEFSQAVGAIILSNHILEKERDGENEINTPIGGENFFTKIKRKAGNKFNQKMGNLFGYDDLEGKQ